MDRPILFLDVDGPLIPFGPSFSRAQAVASESGLFPDRGNPLLERLNPAIGPRLMALGCDLVWATTWAEEANESVAPRIGLPRLPVVEWPEAALDNGPRGLHWKTRYLVEWAGHRPFIWIDDEISAMDRQWVAAQHHRPALLHRVDPGQGLTEGDFITLAGWLRTIHRSPVIEVRSMGLDDIDAVSAVRVSGWQAAYAGIVPQSYLDTMSIEKDAAQRRQHTTAASQVENFVSTEDGVVTGWAAIGPRAGDARGEAAELYALYVRPDRIGTGVGRRLLEAARSWATERGYRGMELWVLADNVRARQFYARAGFWPDGMERVEEYDGVALRDLHYVGETNVPL